MTLDRRQFLRKTAFTAGVGSLASQGAADDGQVEHTDSATITIQRRIPIRHDVDVFVAGGGPSGISVNGLQNKLKQMGAFLPNC